MALSQGSHSVLPFGAKAESSLDLCKTENYQFNDILFGKSWPIMRNSKLGGAVFLKAPFLPVAWPPPPQSYFKSVVWGIPCLAGKKNIQNGDFFPLPNSKLRKNLLASPPKFLCYGEKKKTQSLAGPWTTFFVINILTMTKNIKITYN